MEVLLEAIVDLCVVVGSQILLLLAIFVAGNWLIRKLMWVLEQGKALERLDGSVRTFSLSVIKMGLYILLIITLIGLLGVPMASIITVIASAGVTIGLALQGALSNLAGGLMLVIFKPFKVGDYVDAAGVSGTVKAVTLFYTVILTSDNCRVTVPNGTLMNANVTDYSSEELRRVDLNFLCGKEESPARVQELMQQVLRADSRVLRQPETFARLTASTANSLRFTVRAWCRNEDYWDLYYDLNQKITEALNEAAVNVPSVRFVSAPPAKE